MQLVTCILQGATKYLTFTTQVMDITWYYGTPSQGSQTFGHLTNKDCTQSKNVIWKQLLTVLFEARHVVNDHPSSDRK